MDNDEFFNSSSLANYGFGGNQASLLPWMSPEAIETTEAPSNSADLEPWVSPEAIETAEALSDSADLAWIGLNM